MDTTVLDPVRPLTAALPKPRALLFDWDNTLVDTWPCITRATNITREAMGLAPWDAAEMRARIMGSLRDTFPAIYGERWQEAREIYHRTFAASHLEMLKAAPHAEELLTGGRAAGLYMGVVSNKTGHYLRAEAAHLGWTGFFGRLVGAQDAAQDKPSSEPVHLALRDSRIAADPSVWFIGDAPIDVDCGRAAGCTTVILGTAAWNGPQPDRAVADGRVLLGLIRDALGRV